MYVSPNSTIVLCKNLKIDNSYSDTIYFTSASAQEAYFKSKAIATIDNNTYVRKGLGKVRVGIPIASLYNCNYMMFRNQSFENKWFYAFVVSVEYINNQTTELTFDIDVLQTWMFDYSPNQCYVDREHSSTDNPGDNLINEGLDTGEYTFMPNGSFTNLQNDLCICVASTLDDDGNNNNVDGQIYGGLYSGLTFRTYELNASGASNVTSFLQNASDNGREDSIVSIFVAPKQIVSGNGIAGQNNDYTVKRPTSLFDYTHVNNIQEYRPHNKKLLTFPYVGILLYNNQGAQEELAYEYFSDPNNCTFTLWGSSGCAPDVIVIPIGYKHNSDTFIMELTGYPQCGWTTDSYKAWLAKNQPFISNDIDQIQTTTSYKAGSINIAGNKDKANTINSVINRASNAAQGISSAIGGVAGIDTAINPGKTVANAVNAGINAATQGFNASNDIYQYEQNKAQRTLDAAYNNNMAQLQIERLMAQKQVAQLTPPSYHGTSVGAAKLYCKDFAIRICAFSIQPQFAKRIDEYWDLFGYKTNRVKVPNRAVRPHWTYCKTQGCNFSGSVPMNDMSQIRALYDGGIRWWKNGDEIGNYSLNNTV